MDPRTGPFGARRADRFEAWLRAPAALESAHPRFDVRRALPSEFEAIFDLVDETMGKRSRDLYDWRYRRNPCGIARCWIVVDRASGQLVGNTSTWPWPVQQGERAHEGITSGDMVTKRGWQRQGIGTVGIDAFHSHAWFDESTGMGWPNEWSVDATIKRGRAASLVGPNPRAVLMLDTKRYLIEHGWSRAAATLGGPVLDSAAGLWRRLSLRTRSDVAFEEVRRFDSSFDDVTQRCMQWEGFWSPHDAEFLNWRYRDHPAGLYTAHAVSDRGALAGYAVLRIAAGEAWLMELAVPPGRLASALLLHIISVARDAGCSCLRFVAPTGWRHWPLLYRAGFLRTPAQTYVVVNSSNPIALQPESWQWVPGDMDSL